MSLAFTVVFVVMIIYMRINISCPPATCATFNLTWSIPDYYPTSKHWFCSL